MAAFNGTIEALERAYESLRPTLEKNHWGEWVILVDGKIAAVHPSLQHADSLAEQKFPHASPRLVRKVGEPLPDMIRKL